MGVQVGVPRALLYYYYFPLWKVFLENLGAEVVVSRPTTKAILNRGIEYSVEDACLPVKLALGHVAELAGKVDYLFLPRLVSLAPREYICPKFLGFPDVVRQIFPEMKIIDTSINLYHRDRLCRAFTEMGRFFTSRPLRIYQAYRRGLAALSIYRQLLESGLAPEEAVSGLKSPPYRASLTYPPLCRDDGEHRPVVAVISHPYNIYDAYISMNILKRLSSAGIRVITADSLPEALVRKEAAGLPKRLFWTLSQRMVGAAFYFLRDNRVQGLIHVTSFACGPNSMTGELIERRAHSLGTIPMLNLVLDEHTGEAGVITRLEAFLDMVEQRNSGLRGVR